MRFYPALLLVFLLSIHGLSSAEYWQEVHGLKEQIKAYPKQLTGCNAPAFASGSLKDLEKYHVTVLISPYGNLNAEAIKTGVKEKLSSLGQIVEANVPLSEEIPVLFISIEPTGSAIPSTIQVLGKVKIVQNGCELTSVIWSHSFRAEPPAFPVEQDGTVSFVQNQTSPIVQGDALDTLLTAFAEECKVSHPQLSPLTFLIPLTVSK